MSLIGIPIGFYGYIFPGNINLMVIELYKSKRYRNLFIVLGLIVLFESIYCVSSLLFLNVIQLNHKLYNSIELTSSFLILIMGIWMVIENRKDIKRSQQNTVLRGVISIIIHPQQIPFWLIAGVFVRKFAYVKMDNWGLFNFVLFNSIGTLCAMALYMILGNKILNYFSFHIGHINRVIGGVYIFLAFYNISLYFVSLHLLF